MQTMQGIDISIIDSRDDSKVAFIMVNDCKVSFTKAKINDTCYILTLVNNVCHIKLDNKECK